MQSSATFPSLKEAVVFITGGASGIGACMVRGFARQGARVGFVDLCDDASLELVDGLVAEGIEPQALSYQLCDLRDIDALKQSFKQLADELGDATTLINNAANDDRHKWQDVTPDYFDDRMDINLKHIFFAIQTVAPGMISAGRGSIINVSSFSWIEAASNLSVYVSANAAIHGLTRSFARDLGKHRIRVNTIVPGWVTTERQKELWMTKEKFSSHLERQSLPDPVEPMDVANMALFLASDEARMCSGNDFYVNGGVLAT